MLPDLQKIVCDHYSRSQEKTLEERLEELREELKKFIENPFRFSNHCRRRYCLEMFSVLEIGQYSQIQTIADMIFHPQTGYRVIINRLVSSNGVLRGVLLDEMSDFIQYESFEIKNVNR